MKLSILGYGAWGLTQAWLYSKNFKKIMVWGRNATKTEALEKSRKSSYPYEISFPDNIIFTSNLEEAISESDMIIMCIASCAIEELVNKLLQFDLKNKIFINTSKGLDKKTFKTISQLVEKKLNEKEAKFATISGPTLACEILQGNPTCACVACVEKELSIEIQKQFNVNSKFRLYTTDDVLGVELGSSFKNVIAIASGFSYQMKLGENAKGALITRGIREIVRLSTKMGARSETIFGLSGLGDLIATSSSLSSRNFKVGVDLANGLKINEILLNLSQVAEGVWTSFAMCKLGEKFDVETPIAKAIYEAIYTDIKPFEILEKLMNRKLKCENN